MAEFAWAGATGTAWLANADQLESQLLPVNAPLFTAAALRPGHRVLDVGCGRGVTTLAAAAAVGTTGSVVGCDISAELIASAAVARPDDASPAIEWRCADAQTHRFAPRSFDVLLSRFGVMFFADPRAAFANLRSAMAVDGRLAVSVWLPHDQSPLHHRVLDVAAATVAACGGDLPIAAASSGLDAFGDPAFVRSLLGDAGWRDVQFRPHHLPLYLGGAGVTVAEAVATRLAVGPIANALAEVDEATRAAVAAAVEADLAPSFDGTGVLLDAGVAIVTAHA